MTREELELFRRSMAERVKDICSEYGLYGNVIYYEPSPIPGSSRNRLYIIAGTDPCYGSESLPKNVSPEDIFRSIARDETLFYPNAFALDLFSNKDEMQVMQVLTTYCQKAEFVRRIYGEYDLDPPDKLRHSEVIQLINYRNCLDGFKLNDAAKKKVRADLDWFFRREKSKGFRRSWLDYFRSDKFPDGKGALSKLRGYSQRRESEISASRLMEETNSLRKIEMQEYEYKIFAKFIKERYPEVTYAVSDKETVNHGLTRKPVSGPSGRPVTMEEYAVIRKERFAEDGWSALDGIVPAYWEFRDVYFKAVDEPLVASVYNGIVLQYAKCDPLIELKERGPLCLQKVPAADFMNFVSLAKANKLRFYIDNLGDYATPSLDTINVIYNEHQQEKMVGIVERMIEDKVNYSHVLEDPARPTLSSVISSIEESQQFLVPQDRSIESSYAKENVVKE